jgi:hypothetical protein
VEYAQQTALLNIGTPSLSNHSSSIVSAKTGQQSFMRYVQPYQNALMDVETGTTKLAICSRTRSSSRSATSCEGRRSSQRPQPRAPRSISSTRL